MSIDRHGSTSAVASEEDAMFLDILHEAPLFGQRKPTSIGASILFCILLTGYATLAAATPWIFRPVQALISPLLCSCNVIMLVVTGIFQQYMVYQVQKIRLQGYYVFSQKLKHLVRLPFATTAYGTAAMLLVIVWKPHIFLSISALLRIIMLIEVLCAGFFMSIYIVSLYLGEGSASLEDVRDSNLLSVTDSPLAVVSLDALVVSKYLSMSIPIASRASTSQYRSAGNACYHVYQSHVRGYIHQYNSLDSQPDVLKSLYSPLQQSSPLEGLRYHDGRLADQQMALLQYQRENLHFLSEEILRLQECLSKYERSNDGITPQVDLAHLLATRDQELRTLSAEMNQMQSELRLARSLIAERDSEIQRVRITNNQYIEENERLRAILGEWSTRAAKLERALESERMSNMELQKKVVVARHQQQRGTQESTGLP